MEIFWFPVNIFDFCHMAGYKIKSPPTKTWGRDKSKFTEGKNQNTCYLKISTPLNRFQLPWEGEVTSLSKWWKILLFHTFLLLYFKSKRFRYARNLNFIWYLLFLEIINTQVALFRTCNRNSSGRSIFVGHYIHRSLEGCLMFKQWL